MTQANYLSHQVATVTNKVAVTLTIIRIVTQLVHQEIPRTIIKVVVLQVLPVAIQVVLVQIRKVLEVLNSLLQEITKGVVRVVQINN